MKTWKDVQANAKHYKALGIDKVYLNRSDGFDNNYPWELATCVLEGGSHRLDISTSLQFQCEIDGITLSWYLDLEPSDANGSSEYHIDSQSIVSVLAKLSPICARQLKSILAADAAKVKAKADEYFKAAQKQYGDAALLEELSK
jgi:hypothetical protein